MYYNAKSLRRNFINCMARNCNTCKAYLAMLIQRNGSLLCSCGICFSESLFFIVKVNGPFHSCNKLSFLSKFLGYFLPIIPIQKEIGLFSCLLLYLASFS